MAWRVLMGGALALALAACTTMVTFAPNGRTIIPSPSASPR